MKLFLSINKLYAFFLLLLPSLIAVSWINVFIGNAQYNVPNYTVTFVLPALVVAYAASLITAESLNEGYNFTLGRVAFTFIALLGGLYAFSLVLSFFGFQSLFLTAPIPSVVEYDKVAVLGTSTQVDPRETASKFYSAELLFTVILLAFFYAVASLLFKASESTNIVKHYLTTTKKRKVSSGKNKKNTGKKSRRKKK